MGDQLKDKVAVVTGSGQGIGRAIAIAMARHGARVVTNNRQPGSTGVSAYGDSFLNSLSGEVKEWMLKRGSQLTGDAETTAREITATGGEAVPFFGDVADFDVAQKLVQTAIDSFGRIDILVNVAGTFRHSPVWEMSEEIWDCVTLGKPKSYFNCIRHASPYMMAQGWGRILNCTSLEWLGTLAFDHSNYAAANAGVVGLTRAVAREVYNYGITCNAFVPSALTRATVTAIARARATENSGAPSMPKEEVERYEARPGPDALTPFLIYLCSDEAARVSGTVFRLMGSYIGLYSEPEVIKSINKSEGLWTVEELMQQVPRVLLERYQSPAEADAMKHGKTRTSEK